MATQKDSSVLLKGLTLSETVASTEENTKILGKRLGLIYAASGGYGMRQRTYFYKGVQRWTLQSCVDVKKSWDRMSLELTNSKRHATGMVQ